MATSTGPKLLQQSEKVLLHGINPELMAYCPTMDLLAVVTEEQNLDVYRINGQKAFGVLRKNAKCEIDFICWKFNGQAIAVAWSDGLMDIISAETGKVLQKDVPLPASAGDKHRIQRIGWGVNFIDIEAVKARSAARGSKKPSLRLDMETLTADDWDTAHDDTGTLDELLERQLDIGSIEIAPDLPAQLAMMDMETLLPKLPALPLPPASPFPRMGIQKDLGEFSTQAQVDAIFHSSHLRDHNSVDMLVRCCEGGGVYPSIYDSLETIDVGLSEEWDVVEAKTVMHASHPYSCSHSLLMEMKGSKDEETKLALVPLTLGFIPSAGVYLHLIASKTAQLQNLLSYIQQCLQRMRAFWKQSQDLPGRFMANVTEMLEEKGSGSLVENLYHLACTGHCPPVIKEWLVDQLAESGHKRWDNAVTTSLTQLLSLIHENLLPAIDRCSISISRLRGLAQYHDSGWIFNIPIASFTALLSHLKTLRLLAHTILIYAIDERKQFTVFSKWLRYEIDFEATEPGSQSREEMENRDPGVDTGMLLEYIRYSLTSSDLKPYLCAEADLSPELRNMEVVDYDDTRKAIELLKQEAKYKEQSVCLDHVFRHFREGCVELFQRISAWQAGSTRMDTGIVIEHGKVGAVDVRMVVEDSTSTSPSTSHPPTPTSETTITTHIAVIPSSSPNTLHLHLLTHPPEITTFSKSLHTYSTRHLTFPHSTILDTKFIDDEILLVLLQSHGKENESPAYKLLYIPYTSSHQHYTTVPHSPLQNLFLPAAASAQIPHSHPPHRVSDKQIQQYTKHVFEPRFQPLRMVVNGRKGRRVVVVLEKERKWYRILDLDWVGEEEEGKAEGRRGKGKGKGKDDDDDVEMKG